MNFSKRGKNTEAPCLFCPGTISLGNFERGEGKKTWEEGD